MSQRILSLCLCVLSTTASAGGFAIPEQSARAMGMAGAGTGSSEGASGVFYNPGNLAFEDGTSMEVSGIFIAPVFQFSPLRGEEGKATSANPQLFVLPTLFVAYPLSERLQVGLGGFSNYGLGVSWPDSFPGRFESSSSSLVTYTVNPSLSYRLNEDVGVGVGIDVVRGTVELAQKLNFIDTEGSLRVGGGAFGVGANAGVTARILNRKMQVGAHYRSAVGLGFQGRAHFDVPVEFRDTLVDQAVSTRLTLPHQFALGASYKVLPKLKLHLDMQYTLWTAFDAIRIDFQDTASLNQLQPRNWNNTFTLRMAGEYAWDEHLTLRAGAGLDPSPSPSNTLSPSLPDSARTLLSVGAGYKLGNFSIDLGYLLALFTPRDTTPDAFPANYSGQVHVAGLSLSFRQ